MRCFAIGDTQTVLGFRLVGVEGAVATDREQAVAAFERAVADKGIGLVLVAEPVAKTIRAEIETRLYGFGFPLVLEIPDASGPDPERSTIEDVVRQAMGVSV
jgi:V/A-type H+-transporting ATPase subunit F